MQHVFFLHQMTLIVIWIHCIKAEVNVKLQINNNKMLHDTFPTPIPLGVDLWCWVCQVKKAKANRPWNYFPSIPTYVTTIPQRHRETDEQLAVEIVRSV